MNTAKRKAVGSHEGKTDGQSRQLNRTTLDFNRQVFEALPAKPRWIATVGKTAKRVLPFAFGLSTMLNAALLFVPAEMTRRGYFAIGGEWGLIFLTGGLVAWLSRLICKGGSR